jgi:Arc/MetJ family transcription regulator
MVQLFFFHLFRSVLHMLMCNTLHMPTNLALDDQLIEAARRAGKHKTKKEAVTAALDEYVRKRKQMRILEVFGTLAVDPAYDYKAERQRNLSRDPIGNASKSSSKSPNENARRARAGRRP